MKWAASLTLSLMVLSVSSLTNAQPVNGRPPVVVPARYVSSSSPMNDGRTVRTTYAAGSDTTVTVVAEPYRVSKGSAIQGNSNNQASWRTVEPRRAVSPASTSSSNLTTTPQPAPPAVNRYPVSTTAVPRTVVYYVQGTEGQVVQAPGGSATVPPTTIHPAPGAGTEATQPPAIECPAPPVAAPQAAVPVNPSNTVYKPVLPLRRSIGGAYVSRGIWGQPKAYVPKEPVRNFFRYILP